MIFNLILPLAVFIVLIGCIAFFSSSETAFLSISKFTLRKMLKNRESGAKLISKLSSNMDQLLTVILIGINFFSILASSIGAAVAISIIGEHFGITVSTLLVTFIITIGGEIVPKTIAAYHPVKIAKNNAFILLVLEKLLFPLVFFFSMLSKTAANIAEKAWKHKEPLITEEELKTLIDVGTNEGTLEKSEQSMFYKIFEFNDLHVHDIMRHRSLIKAIPDNLNRKELIQAFTQTGFSRLPVYKDSIENITGILHYKNLLFAPPKEANQENFIRQNQTQALFVPESLTAIELLMQFKKTNNDIAICLNEQGAVSGLITIDDILRTVFGRISDESSRAEIPPEKRIKVISANEFLVPGDMKLIDFNSLLKLNLVSENFTTLGGWILEHFDYLPSTGEITKDGETLFIVEDQTNRRIQSVRIKLGFFK